MSLLAVTGRTPIKQACVSQSGFTLLEILIALVITMLIGMGSAQILKTAIDSSHKVSEKIDELNALQKTMLLMSRDFKQVLPRAVRNEYGDYVAAISSQSDLYDLEFTRAGWPNSMDDVHRSELQRVAYEVDQDKLVRHYWSVLDATHGTDIIHRTILGGVESLSFQFMNSENSWIDQWPPSDSQSGDDEEQEDPRFNVSQLPRAVRISLDTKQFGSIARVYELVGYLPNQTFSSDGEADPNPDSGGNP